MDKRGFEFNFALLFSIIVGCVVLFLAIYSANQIIKTGSKQEESVVAKQFSIIFDPMEVGVAEGKSLVFSFKDEAKLYNECFDGGLFGYQRFKVSLKKFRRWQEKGVGIKVSNKYVFSDSIERGKKFIIFSKPLRIPFKISELIFVSSKNYCFKQTPSFIKEEIESLNLKNIKFSDCSENDIVVCFASASSICSGGDIIVEGQCNDYNCESEFDYGRVKKNGYEIYYYGNLIYGAIFSSKKIYECNVKRLMKRLINLALLYSNEANFIKGRSDCGTISSSSLIELASLANIGNSHDLVNPNFLNKINEVEEENNAAECGIW